MASVVIQPLTYYPPSHPTLPATNPFLFAFVSVLCNPFRWSYELITGRQNGVNKRIFDTGRLVIRVCSKELIHLLT